MGKIDPKALQEEEKEESRQIGFGLIYDEEKGTIPIVLNEYDPPNYLDGYRMMTQFIENMLTEYVQKATNNVEDAEDTTEAEQPTG